MKICLLNCFAGCLLALLLFSCKKQEIGKMKKGKYEMTLIRTLKNGTQETYHCQGYGPRKSSNDYLFQSEIDNNGLWLIRVYAQNKSKKYAYVESYYGFNISYSTGYSSIDSYDLSEKDMTIRYTSPMDTSTGVIELKWIGL